MIKIGVDEVGRGALAGDLVVVAYAFRLDLSFDQKQHVLSLCKDSKAFSSRKKREAVFETISEAGVFEVSRADPDMIEMINIRQAVLHCFTQSSQNLARRLGSCVECIFDGRDCPPNLSLPAGSCASSLIKGDAKVPEISAASVLAKVMRDREMEALDVSFPHYQWAANAGYGTKAHTDAIKSHGLSPHHRSWSEKFL